MYTTQPTGFEGFEAMIPLLVFLGLLYGILLLGGLVSYILRGLAQSNMSKARGMGNHWLGFIPYARNYQLGQIAGEIELGNKVIRNPGLWVLLAPIIFTFVFVVGYVIVMVPYMIGIFRFVETEAVDQLLGSIVLFTIMLLIFVVVVTIAQVFLYLIIYLTYHRIFSHYVKGQKPVYYLIIAMFVPLAASVLLFMLSKKPLLSDQLSPDLVAVGEPSVVETSVPVEAPVTEEIAIVAPPIVAKPTPDETAAPEEVDSYA